MQDDSSDDDGDDNEGASHDQPMTDVSTVLEAAVAATTEPSASADAGAARTVSVALLPSPTAPDEVHVDIQAVPSTTADELEHDDQQQQQQPPVIHDGMAEVEMDSEPYASSSDDSDSSSSSSDDESEAALDYEQMRALIDQAYK